MLDAEQHVIVLAGDVGHALGYARTLDWAGPSHYHVSSISHLLWTLDEIESSQAAWNIVFVPALNPWLLHYIKNHAWWAEVEFHSFDALYTGQTVQVGELWQHK
jgi:hypothetical protein